MYTHSRKTIRLTFNASSGNGDAVHVFSNEAGVFVIEHNGSGLHLRVSGQDAHIKNMRAKMNAAAFDRDPLWTPTPDTRKATAEGIQQFIAETEKLETQQHTARQEIETHLRGIRVMIG